MWVWKCLSRHVTYSESILKAYVLTVMLQIKPSDLSLLILVCGQLKFLGVGTSSTELPQTFRFMIIRTRIAQQTKSLLGHCPLCDIDHWRIYRAGVEAAEHKVGLYFPEFVLPVSGSWQFMTCTFMLLMLLVPCLQCPFQLYYSLWRNAVGPEDAGVGNLCWGRESTMELRPFLVWIPTAARSSAGKCPHCSGAGTTTTDLWLNHDAPFLLFSFAGENLDSMEMLSLWSVNKKKCSQWGSLCVQAWSWSCEVLPLAGVALQDLTAWGLVVAELKKAFPLKSQVPWFSIHYICFLWD